VALGRLYYKTNNFIKSIEIYSGVFEKHYFALDLLIYLFSSCPEENGLFPTRYEPGFSEFLSKRASQ